MGGTREEKSTEVEESDEVELLVAHVSALI